MDIATKNEKRREYYNKNKDRIKDYRKMWYDKNRDKINEKRREYYNKNKDKINARRYASENLKRQQQLQSGEVEVQNESAEVIVEN